MKQRNQVCPRITRLIFFFGIFPFASIRVIRGLLASSLDIRASSLNSRLFVSIRLPCHSYMSPLVPEVYLVLRGSLKI